MLTMNRKWRILIIFAVLVCIAQTSTAQEDIARKSQNPVGDIISLPFEYWHYGGMANGGSADAIMVKPVYPVRIGNVNLINRVIIPYLGIDANRKGSDLGEIDIPPTLSRESGLGNIQYQGFLTPAKPGKIIWGVGPVFELPTNTSGLGSDKWSAGPAAVALSMLCWTRPRTEPHLPISRASTAACEANGTKKTPRCINEKWTKYERASSTRIGVRRWPRC